MDYQQSRCAITILKLIVTGIGGLANDWINKNWYFTDIDHERIFMCNITDLRSTKTSLCVTLITTDLKSPKQIAVDPIAG